MDNDIVITGMSTVNCLGSNLDEIWKNLLDNKNFCRQITNYNPNDYPSIKDVKYGYEFDLTDEMIKYAENAHMKSNLFGKLTISSIYTYKKAIECSGLDTNTEKRGAVLFSTLYSESFEKLERAKFITGNSNISRYNPKYSIIEEYDFIPGLICGIYGFTGGNAMISSACASTIMSIDYAKKMLLDNDVDFVIIGGGDINVNPFSINKYLMARAHPTIDNKIMCRPLDKTRYGMVVGDGAGAIVLEKRSFAENRGAKIYATISSIGIASDNYHPTKPSDDGVGIKRVIDIALKKANLNSCDIDYINAHATGTILGDEIEFNSLNKIFPGKYVNSFKGYIGHLTAAAGVVELILSVLSMNNSTIIKSINVDDPLTGDLIVSTSNINKKIKHVLKTAYGFGGKCAAIILRNEKQ